MSSVKKNKNKNKLPSTMPSAASTPGSAASASASAHLAAAPRAATAASAHPPAKGSKAAMMQSSAGNTTTPAAAAPAARASLIAAADDDDEGAPLPRGAVRKPAAAAAAPHAADTSSLPTPTTTDADAKPRDDVLFGNKRSQKEEEKAAKLAAAKKRKAEAASTSAAKKAKGAAGADEEGIDLFTGTTTSATLRHLSDPLSHSSLKPGMLLLGAVRAVNEVDLTVQLPHGLTGYVSMREVSDSIADIVDRYIEQGEQAEAAASAGGESKEADAPAPINLPTLSDFIQVGQLVHCTILSVGEGVATASGAGSVKHSGAAVSTQRSRRIEISLRAALFNQHLSLGSLYEGRLLYGSIKSVQEKGYVVDVGISGNNVAVASIPGALAPTDAITAFLPFGQAPADLLLPAAKKTGRVAKKDAAASSSATRRLPVGMPITTVITSAANKRVLLLTADPAVVNVSTLRNSAMHAEEGEEEEADAATALRQSIGFTNLQPGQLVRAEIVSVISAADAQKNNARMSGLYVRFLDFFHAIVDTLHSSSDASIAGSLESMYRPGQKVTARLLYINFVGKKIALSLLPHIVANEPFKFPASVKAGDRIMDSIVTKVEPRNGVYLRLPVEGMEASSMATAAEKARKVKEEEKQQRKEEREQQKKARVAQRKKAAKLAGMKDVGEEDDEEEEEAASDDEDADAAAASDADEEDVSGELSLSAWAHISRLSDERLTHVPKSMTVGSTLPCRILNFHYLDGLVHVSTQKHIMEQSILYYEDVKSGMDVQGEVVSVESFGVLLKLTPHLTSLIPALHLSDVHLSDPSKKFKVGQTLKARVLYVDQANKKIICTLKKSLIASALPQLHSYTTAAEGVSAGLVTHGYIASVKEYGLIVEFYGQTHGLVPVADLLRTGFMKEGMEVSKVFKRGEVHKVRVVSCDPKHQRMKLSMGLVKPEKEEATGVKKEAAASVVDPLDEIAVPGKFLAGHVKKVQEDGLLVALDLEGGAAAAADKKSKGKKSKASADAELTVFLPASQVTDHPSLVQPLLQSFKVGQALTDLLVLHKDKASKQHVVSMKPALIKAAKAASSTADSASPFTLPSSYDTVQPGQLLLGFVKSITDFGVFVAALDGLSALAPRGSVSDTFVAGPLTEAFAVGQTVRAKVLSVEVKEGESVPRVTLTLKPSQLYEDQAANKEQIVLDAEADFTKSYFDDAVRAGVVPAKAEHAAPAAPAAAPAAAAGKKRKSAAVAPAAAALSLGESLSVKVEEVGAHHLVLALAAPQQEGSFGYALPNTANTSTSVAPAALFQVGQTVRARVSSLPRSSDDRLLLVVDLEEVVSLARSGAKGAAKTAKVSKNDLQFVDPALSKLGDLQNGRKLLVKIKALVGEGAAAHLEVTLGSIAAPAGATGAASARKEITGRVPLSELEDPLFLRLSAGDKDAKALAKSSAYVPAKVWGARVGQTVPARITSIVRKALATAASKGKTAAKDKESKKFISSIDLTLRPSIVSAADIPAAASVSGKKSSSPAPLVLVDPASLKESQLLQVIVKDVEVHPTEAGSIPTIWAVVCPGLKARLRCTDLSFPPSDPDSKKALADLPSRFVPGQALTTQVLAVYPERHLVEVALLPLGATKAKVFPADTLEHVRAQVARAKQARSPHNVVKAGQIIHNVTVKKIIPAVGLLVSFATSKSAASGEQHERFGRVHITDLSDRWTPNPLDAFSVGQKLPAAFVLSVRARPATSSDAMEVDEEGEGEEGGASAKKSTQQQQVDLSLRPSRLTPKAKKVTKSKYPELVGGLDALVGKEGAIVQGYVNTISKAGCFIALSHDVDARCLLKNLSDDFVTDIGRAFPPGKFLPRVRILSVDAEKRTVEVTLRKHDGPKGGKGAAGAGVGDRATTAPNGQPLHTFESLSVGDVVKGFVTSIKPFGVFVRLAQSSLSSLCHISEVSDGARITNLADHYEVGDKVRAKIIKKDEEGRKVSIGLKAKYFEGMPPESEDDEEDDDDDDQEGDEDEEGDLQIPDDDEEDEEEEATAAAATPKAPASKKARTGASPAAAPAAAASTSLIPPLPGADDDDMEMAAAPALDLNSSFSMLTSGSHSADAAPVADSDASDDEDDEEGDEDASGNAKKKSRRAKAGAKKVAEKALRSREVAVLDTEAQPETADDFERLLVQDPNSSMVWIKYMAYQISLTEIDAARALAARALKAISFRNAQDKLNVWVALLNLENMYGTAATLKEVLQRALQYNDPLTVTMELAKIYAATKKTEQCIETYEGALKKFHALPSIWLAYGSYLYTQPDRIAAGRELLKRALARLDKSEHVALLVRWASLEFHVAHNVDRGRTLLEGVMSTYPKRVDLWAVYLDMELKLARQLAEAHEQAGTSAAAAVARDPNALNHESVRRLFERVTSLSLNHKKMKVFFQKYLAFEKANGNDPARIEAVKNKARQFVASKAQADE